MIELHSVSKSFSTQLKAVDDVSLTVAEGDKMILLGPSGCGKTTVLRMINRLIEPDAGSIIINGKLIESYNIHELRKGMGYVIQQHGLFPHFTIEENISLVPKLQKKSAAQIRSIVDSLMYKLHLDPAIHSKLYPAQLSGGQQQRVGLARALAGDPPILLMDEPFGALDPVTRAAIVQDFMELDELKQKTIILVTHDVSEAFQLGDTLCVLDKGRVQAQGRKADILFGKNNDFVNAFLVNDRFRLELQVLTLMDIWNEIPSNNYDPITGYGIIPSTTSLHQSLSQCSSIQENSPIACQFNDEIKLISPNIILDGYRSFKNNKHE